MGTVSFTWQFFRCENCQLFLAVCQFQVLSVVISRCGSAGVVCCSLEFRISRTRGGLLFLAVLLEIGGVKSGSGGAFVS